MSHGHESQLKVSIYGPSPLRCNEGFVGDKHARARHSEFIAQPTLSRDFKPALREVLQRDLNRVKGAVEGRYMAVVVWPDRSNCIYLFQVEPAANYTITDIE